MIRPLDRVEIAKLIPHAGTMCLLDAVLDWDATTISCRASSHRSSDNPMAVEGRLAAVCGIEYAAQAMAAHARLTGTVHAQPMAGYLASVRDVVCAVARLDLLAGDLLITAEQLLGDDRRAIYRFSLRCEGDLVMQGRAAVVLHDNAATPGEAGAQ